GSVSRPAVHKEARELARHIRRMAMLVRAAADLTVAHRALGRDAGGDAGGNAGDEASGGGCASGGCSSGGCSSGGCASGGCSSGGFAEAEAEQERADSGRGWWVLAQGGPLDENDFQAREAAREALLERVRRAGILVGENVWVWDLSGRAQLVLTTLPTLERARKVAKRLREKGLAIVVRREMPEGPTRR
ncbi:MAG: hypothetical protein KKF77_08855, partial [Proteobacteria bacterium]|nr:hypothetical protein [Pseudomonadota bacterium]